MSRLIAAVYLRDPDTHEELVLLPGENPPQEIAALITNPDAWGVPPGSAGAETASESVLAGETDASGAEPAVQSGEGGSKKAPQRRSRSSTVS